MFHRNRSPRRQAQAQSSSLERSRLARRQADNQLVTRLGPLNSSLEEYYTYAPLPDGHNAELKVIRPKSASAGGNTSGASPDGAGQGHPLIVLFHGGGFSSGNVEYMTRPARDFALEFDSVVISATYRLAPEHTFPTPMQDAWDTLVWLAQHARDFGTNPAAGFVVGGVSAGGTMAALVTQLAKDRNLSPALTGSWVCIPLLLVKEIVPPKYECDWRSMEENKNSPGLSREVVHNIIRTLRPDVRSALFSPFNSKIPHVGLPPTFVQVGGLDVLRDDGIILEKALRENGVPTRIDIAADLGHSAWTIYATPYSRITLGPKTMAGMRWLLGREERTGDRQ
jgi:acetyl esterase/lipase